MIKHAEIAPTPEGNFAIARFATLMPDDEKPKGVIVMTPGSNGDGTNMIHSPRWQRFAKVHNLALVGCYFYDKSPSPAEWYANAAHGSGQALLEALKGFGLEATKLLLWGFSAGGEFNYELACWLAPQEPGRVAAFVVNKGGFYYTALAPEEARLIPAVWFIGGADAPFRRHALHGIFDMNEILGCKWTKDVEPIEHVIGNSERVAMDLFTRVLQKNDHV